MRTNRTPWSGGLLAALVLASVLSPRGASAGFPPPENATAADMADPQNWPNDPDYGFSADRDGQWNYFSFLPPAAPGVMRRADEVASGMSIDLAWRISIGDPRVVLAITDSGIEWDKPDLVEKAFLNQGELSTHKPLHADQSPCGGDGALAGFDCNGDGVLSISDYKDLLQGSDGDRNGNGLLDPGDLILAFSDGIDDDKNGYVDDISGWDFFKDDNDPYDDTRYGHGTGEAGDSVSQANNGIGSAGACPLCRFLPMRVGDSFIADVQDFGEAVVYATDNGAKVVQCALGTIDMTRFAQAALDYAYEKNVLVITSMADENSRHHNMPAAANHTLPVHAIRYDGSSAATSRSFFAYHPCSNFGGQNFLSASGGSCSSEATGQLSGIAGLVVSAATTYGLKLTPGEIHSLFFGTADDIDVPESREPEAFYRYSQPGFDQRFGYGRVNANRALEAIRDGRIPPAVDIVSPRWFEVLYADRASGPIEIHGTVSAARANAYDFVVEWASGVQPLEDAFEGHTLAHEDNVDPTMVAGAAGPLALFDVRNVTLDHPRDVDSLHGENDHTITVRVRSVAHYGGTIGDVHGEMRRTYYVHDDPDLALGFPYFIGDSGEASPKMADVDGDGVRELVVPTGGGLIHVLNLTKSGPVPLPGFPFATSRIDGLASPPHAPGAASYLDAPGYATGAVDVDLAREGFVNAPAVADLDGDGSVEIVATSFAGTIYVVEPDGSLRPGFPLRLPDVPSCPQSPSAPPPQGPCMSVSSKRARGAFASPVLVDLDLDGRLDIVQAAFDGKVHVIDAAGAPVAGFPVEPHYTGDMGPEPARSRILTTPAVADLNGDAIPDLVVGSNEQLGGSGQFGALYVVDGRGMNAPSGPILEGWPVTMSSFELFPLVAEGLPNSPAVARFGDELGVVAHGNVSLPFILPAVPGPQSSLGSVPPNALPARPDPTDPSTTLRGLEPSSIFGPLTKASQPNTMLPLFSVPSVGDVDQDGVPDIVASGGSLTLIGSVTGGSTTDGDHLLSVWSGKTGAMLPGSPFILEDFTFFNNHAIADLDGDDYPEIITGSGGYFLHAYDGCGREPEGFPKFTGQWIIPTAAVGDLDGDGSLEVAVSTRSGFLYVWHTRGRADGVVAWESYHHDNRNTGSLEFPLDQGVLHKAKTPLTVETCAVPRVPVMLEGGGGCDCRVPRRDRENHAAAGLFVGLALVLARRRAFRALPR